MTQAEEITRRCVSKISLLLPFKDEVHILEAVHEAMHAGRMEAAALVQQNYEASLCDGSPGPIVHAILQMNQTKPTE